MGNAVLFVTDMHFIKEIMMSKTASFPKHIPHNEVLLFVRLSPPMSRQLKALLVSRRVAMIQV